MITAATYLKMPFFASRERLDLLQRWVFDFSVRYGAAL
jgi:hypothetical protein